MYVINGLAQAPLRFPRSDRNSGVDTDDSVWTYTLTTTPFDLFLPWLMDENNAKSKDKLPDTPGDVPGKRDPKQQKHQSPMPSNGVKSWDASIRPPNRPTPLQ